MSEYLYTRDLAVVEKYLAPLNGGAIYFDVETTGLNWQTDKLLLIQLWQPGKPVLVIDARGVNIHSEIAEYVAYLLKPVFESTRFLKVAHNATFDIKWLREKLGLNTVRVYDTMIAEMVLQAGLSHEMPSLKGLLKKYLGQEVDKSIRLSFLDWGDKEKFKAPFPAELLEYAANDVTFLAPIQQQQWALLEQYGLLDIARLEQAVLLVMADMEYRGVQIDKEKWRALLVILRDKAATLEGALVAELNPYVDVWRNNRQAQQLQAYAERVATWKADVAEWEARLNFYESSWGYRQGIDTLVDELGLSLKAAHTQLRQEWKRQFKRPTKPTAPKQGEGPINLGSHIQLSGALDEMGVELPYKADRTLDTDKFTMALFADEYPVLQRILDWRGVAKLTTSFGENILTLCDAKGRLHPQCRQVLATGRTAFNSPNVQQIPANEEGGSIRQCFVAPEGYTLCSLDYSQIELRVLAYVTQEPTMLEAFKQGEDLHSLTAIAMFNLTCLSNEVKDKYPHIRKAAKSINFGFAYGISAWGLARQLKIPYDEAARNMLKLIS
jgi:DNA polymerase I-like protein with 3'-5' exonuclease and polymerase domains